MAQSDPQTSEALPVKDEPIDNSPDPTAEEAQRALAGMEQVNEPVPVKKDEPEELQYVDDPRAEITKNFRARRSDVAANPATPEPDDIDPNSAAALYGTDVVAADTQVRNEPAPVDLNTKVRVKINGVEQDVPLQSIVSNYQKVQAGDAYLQNAKQTADQIINSAKALTATKTDGEDAPGAPGTSTEHPATTSTPKAKFDRDRLAKAVEAISLGSTEEGVNALQEVLEAAPQPQTTDISTEIRNVLANDRLVEQSVGATDAFLKKYPDLASDPILKNVSGELISQEMVKDFVSAGLTNEEISKMAPDRASLKRLHDMARIKNPSFGRSMGQLFEVVEKAPHFVKLVGGASNAPKVTVDVDRSGRKVLLQPQPALRTPPPMPGQGQQQPVSRQAGIRKGFEQVAAGRSG